MGRSMFNMFAPASSSRDGLTALQRIPYVLSREGYCNKTKLGKCQRIVWEGRSGAAAVQVWKSRAERRYWRKKSWALVRAY